MLEVAWECGKVGGRIFYFCHHIKLDNNLQVGNGNLQTLDDNPLCQTGNDFAITKIINMKCPYCGEQHPDNFTFCPNSGRRIEVQHKSCENRDCPDFGKSILPPDAKFCPRCGKPLNDSQKDLSLEEKSEAQPTLDFTKLRPKDLSNFFN